MVNKQVEIEWLNVVYKGKINDKLDEELKKLLKQFRLYEHGSGYYLIKRERDIKFKN